MQTPGQRVQLKVTFNRRQLERVGVGGCPGYAGIPPTMFIRGRRTGVIEYNVRFVNVAVACLRTAGSFGAAHQTAN